MLKRRSNFQRGARLNHYPAPILTRVIRIQIAVIRYSGLTSDGRILLHYSWDVIETGGPSLNDEIHIHEESAIIITDMLLLQ